MAGPFKMKGFSPFHQDEKKGLKEKKTQLPKKYRLGKKTDRKTGKVTYEKIDQNGVSTVISESEYNSLKGN